MSRFGSPGTSVLDRQRIILRGALGGRHPPKKKNGLTSTEFACCRDAGANARGLAMMRSTVCWLDRVGGCFWWLQRSLTSVGQPRGSSDTTGGPLSLRRSDVVTYRLPSGGYNGCQEISSYGDGCRSTDRARKRFTSSFGWAAGSWRVIVSPTAISTGISTCTVRTSEHNYLGNFSTIAHTSLRTHYASL